jgi:hypothetical protein
MISDFPGSGDFNQCPAQAFYRTNPGHEPGFLLLKEHITYAGISGSHRA